MTQLEHIQTEIVSLSKHDIIKLKDWIDAKDWDDWDKQIEADSAAGKLDFLKREALAAKSKGTLKEL